MHGNKGKIYFNIYVFLTILRKRKAWCVCCISLAMVIGTVFAFTNPKEYSASLKLVDTDNVQNGGLSDIIAFVGITNSFLNSESAIFPELFPRYITSPDFLREILQKRVETKDGTIRTTYKDYLLHHQKRSLIGKLFSPHSNAADDDYLSRMLALEKIKGETDIKTFAVTITVTDQDPYVAACMTDSVFALLSKRLTTYKINKKRRDLEFVQALLNESKVAYKVASKKFAEERDKDWETVTASEQARFDVLENDMQIKFNLYTMLASQLNVLESDFHKTETTLYVFQNATVPDKPSNKSKMIILIVSAVFGYALWVIAEIILNRKRILTTSDE